MIIKGGARAGPGNLASHLEKDTNERVEIVEIDGLAATTIRDALKEIMAHTAGTACRDGMYHASISPQPGERPLTRDERARTVEVLAEELGLKGQPHIAIEHEKIGADGNARIHQHVIWSRVNEDGKTITDFNNYPAHEQAARSLEIEMGHAPTKGAFDRAPGETRPERTPTHAEWQQAERSGISPKEAKKLLTEIWRQSDSGGAFIGAAAEQGYIVCRGDKRGFMVVDPASEAVTLARRLPDTAAQVAQRMEDVDRDLLPSVDEAKALARERRTATPLEVAADTMEVSAPLSLEPLIAETGVAHVNAGECGLWEPDPEIEVERAASADPVRDLGAPHSDGVVIPERRESIGPNLFADEKPSICAQAADPADIFSKGVGKMADAVGRVAGKVVEIVADFMEGLLGLFTGASAPAVKAEREAHPRPSLPQQSSAAAPKAEPVQRDAAPPATRRSLSKSTPAETFLELAKARLSPGDLARIERENAERATLRDLVGNRSHDHDLGR